MSAGFFLGVELDYLASIKSLFCFFYFAFVFRTFPWQTKSAVTPRHENCFTLHLISSHASV